MIFKETQLAGAFIIECEYLTDDRGYFATEFSADEFKARGLDSRVAQLALSFNQRRGTLRGLHLQVFPHGQAKVIRCHRGAVYDVILDLRDGSPTFGRWQAIELSGGSNLSLYIPEGMAHGFETLVDGTVVSYQLSYPRDAESERGVRWDDPSIGLSWPMSPSVISLRDASFPNLK